MQGNTGKNKLGAVQGLAIFTLTLFIWMVGASAQAVIFTAQNFEIVFPPGWETVTPTPQGVLMVSRSPDGLKLVVVNARELQERDLPTAIAEALGGAKGSEVKHGFLADPEQPLTISGVPFRYFVAHHAETNSMATYAAVAGHELYLIAPINRNGDISTDPELQSIIQSFHLITPVEIPRSVTVATSAAYRAGYQDAQIFLYGVVGTAVVVLLVRFVFLRPKSVSTGPVPPPLKTPPPLPPQMPPKNEEEGHQS